MFTAYRIFKSKHAASWHDGEGAFRYGGRWNSRGFRLLYTSASLSLAALEMLVNLNSEDLLFSYSYATVEFDKSLILPIEKFCKLPPKWNASPPPIEVQQIGDDWAASGISPVLKVPSAAIPMESNYLINIGHEQFANFKLGKPKAFTFDSRLR
jgi:RES domain-containing protein